MKKEIKKALNQEILGKKCLRIFIRLILFMDQKPGREKGRMKRKSDSTQEIRGEKILSRGLISMKMEDRCRPEGVNRCWRANAWWAHFKDLLRPFLSPKT